MFAKNYAWPRNWMAWSKTEGPVPPSPGLKLPLFFINSKGVTPNDGTK